MEVKLKRGSKNTGRILKMGGRVVKLFIGIKKQGLGELAKGGRRVLTGSGLGKASARRRGVKVHWGGNA